MRKWFASLAVLGLVAAAATAQTIPMPPTGGLGQTQQLYFDAGATAANMSWKVNYPTGAFDAFNVDFDTYADNWDVEGVGMNTYCSSSAGALGIGWVGVFADNLTLDPLGNTPDCTGAGTLTMAGAFSGTLPVTGAPGVAGGYCTAYVGYDVPDATATAGVGYHTVMNFMTGDSGLWLCADTTAPDNRSYFSMDRYASTSIALGGYDLHMRILGELNTGTGSAYITLNNLTGQVFVPQAGFLNATLWSDAAVQPTLYVHGIEFGYGFFLTPELLMYTGYENFSPVADQYMGSLTAQLSDPSTGPCVPAGFTCNFYGFYLDNNDLKPKNGHPKIKKTNSVLITVTPDPAGCNPAACFGDVSDGVLDGNIMKVQNPAGTNDYFNVNVGDNSAAAVTSLSAVEIASWDFCGTGPSWGSIGVYAGHSLNPTGAPDIAGGVIATSATLNMAPGAADFSYPATSYPFSTPVTTTSNPLLLSTNVHVAAKWASGDTCTWMGTDGDGIDDDAGAHGPCSVIPSTTTFFTLSGFASGTSSPYPSRNWIMRTY